MVHEVFARFVGEGLDAAAPDALDRLKGFAETAFAGLDAIPERRAIWLRRFETAARQFLDHERQRAEIAIRHAEIDGAWALPIGFTLTGRADRIDIRRDGSAEIIDFKTGSVPSTEEMTNFLAPQLPLEAAMLRAGAFPALTPTDTQAMAFIKIGLGPSAFVPTRFRTSGTIMEAAGEAERRLNGLVAALLKSDALPMTPQVLAKKRRPGFRGDYDHLARVDEWAINEGDDSE
jgi:ATP-dependent helicase/nuclease subunit B